MGPQKEFVKVKPPSGVEIKLVPVACKVPIIAIDKDAAAKDMTLPEDIQEDESKAITAMGTIEPYDGETTVIVSLDIETGESEMRSRREPLPFFRFMNKKEIGARYGMGSEGAVLELYGEWTFACMSSMCASLYAEAEVSSFDDAEAMAGIQIGYQF